METFEDIYTDVLDFVNRPASELLSRAKREVNNALYWIQRKHMFKMSERIFRTTYPANALTIDLTQVAEGTIRDYINVQMVSGTSSNHGVGLRISSYDALLRDRRKFQGLHENHDDALDELSVPPFDSHGATVSSINRYEVFLAGYNKIGLYPTPTAAVELVFNCHIWLPKLVAQNDTNFLIVYGYDVVLMRAVTLMTHFMKEDRRIEQNELLFQEAMRTLFEWDSTVRPNTNE